jgi:hypothetical protein
MSSELTQQTGAMCPASHHTLSTTANDPPENAVQTGRECKVIDNGWVGFVEEDGWLISVWTNFIIESYKSIFPKPGKCGCKFMFLPCSSLNFELRQTSNLQHVL